MGGYSKIYVKKLARESLRQIYQQRSLKNTEKNTRKVGQLPCIIERKFLEIFFYNILYLCPYPQNYVEIF